MHSLLAQASFSYVAKNYFVCMHPWQHLPHSPGLRYSHHLFVCFLYSKKYITPRSGYCAVFAPLLEGVYAFFDDTSFLLICCKELVCLHAPMATPSTLTLPNSHHLLVCFLCSKKCITPKSEYCAVFAALLEGVDGVFVSTSCLLMCCNQLVHLHAPMATHSTLAWPKSHHMLVCFPFCKKCITPKSEYCAVFSPLLEGVDAFCFWDKLSSHVLQRTCSFACTHRNTFHTSLA